MLTETCSIHIYTELESGECPTCNQKLIPFANIIEIIEDTIGEFEGYLFDNGAGKCGYDKACIDILEKIKKLK